MKFFKTKKNLIISLFLLTVIGGLLRFINITNNPNSLNIDEVAIGYNAYSILKTGRDEYGIFLPISFRSVDDYKAPISIYLMVPTIAVLGLNEFSVRFNNAFLSTLSIPLMFLLASEFLSGFGRTTIEYKKSQTIGLIITAIFTISPWAIYFSRYAAEALIAMIFVMLGILFLIKTLKGSRYTAFLSAFFLVLSMYTYHSEKLFVPFFILIFGILFWRRVSEQKKSTITFFMVAILLGLPLVFTTFFGHDATRAEMTFIGKDIEFNRNVFTDSAERDLAVWQFLDNRNFLLFFYWLRKFLFYFHPGFLFFSGLNMTQIGTQGLGIVYLFELPFLLFGIAAILKKKFIYKLLLIFWILLGIIPASLTQNEQHALRTLLVLPAVVFISGYGAFLFFNWLLSFQLYKKWILVALFCILIAGNLIESFIIFAVHFPTERGEDFMEGTKATILYALAHKREYKQIVMDPYRGIYGPDIVSIPHMYVAFYSLYDPHTYQTENHYKDGKNFDFGNFIFRRVDWTQERNTADTLFIASPWSIPEKDVKVDELKGKVYLTNGKLAFIMASPKVLK